MRRITLVITLLVLTILLTSCQPVQPSADTLATEYRLGVADGCLTTMYVLGGPPPDDSALLAGIQLCQAIADELMDVEPVLLPTITPEFTL